MNTVVETRGLGKRFGRRWALADCTLAIPAGHVVGLVGPNGAGKSTLLNLAAGLLSPSTGIVEVLGRRPGCDPAQLAEVGFVAQDAPVYVGLTVGEHLTLGARLNPGWDDGYARGRVADLRLDCAQRAGKLSGGQRAQLSLTMAVAKRPRLLILDEPVASLDPLARREFLDHLANAVAGNDVSVVLSSHLVSDLARVCDHLIVLSAARVQAAGPISELLAAHRSITGPPGAPTPAGWPVIAGRADGTGIVVRVGAAITHDPAWTLSEPALDELVLAYLSRGRGEASEVTA